MKVRDIFNACAQVYDQDRPRLIPSFDLFYGELIRQIPFPADAPIRILDVGAGTGLVSSMLGRRFPFAHFVLTDFAPKMLDVARARFEGSQQYEFLICDSRELGFENQFDAVVSALSIHHLKHDEKREVYRRIFRALKPGGAFVHSEQVLGPTPELEKQYQEVWLETVRATGLPEDRVQASIIRCKEDLNAPLQDQLDWLKAIGFEQVDCWFKNYRFAVFGGRKPKARQNF